MRMIAKPALGMIETVGITGLIAAADAAAKAADVKVIGRQGADAGIVTVYVVGDVAAVESAVRAGEAEAERVGRIRSAHVIPRPDPDVLRMLGYGPKSGGGDQPPGKAAAKEARPEANSSGGPGRDAAPSGRGGGGETAGAAAPAEPGERGADGERRPADEPSGTAGHDRPDAAARRDAKDKPEAADRSAGPDAPNSGSFRGDRSDSDGESDKFGSRKGRR